MKRQVICTCPANPDSVKNTSHLKIAPFSFVRLLFLERERIMGKEAQAVDAEVSTANTLKVEHTGFVNEVDIEEVDRLVDFYKNYDPCRIQTEEIFPQQTSCEQGMFVEFDELISIMASTNCDDCCECPVCQHDFARNVYESVKGFKVCEEHMAEVLVNAAEITAENDCNHREPEEKPDFVFCIVNQFLKAEDFWHSTAEIAMEILRKKYTIE